MQLSISKNDLFSIFFYVIVIVIVIIVIEWVNEEKKTHTHIHCDSHIVYPLLPFVPMKQKKTSKMMNSLVTCLNCPPSVWLSASFTPAIFSHFANLPTRWDDGMLLKVLWLQMSRPDVPLFLQWPCDFIFYQFPALFTFSTPPPHTHTHKPNTHTKQWPVGHCIPMHANGFPNILWD